MCTGSPAPANASATAVSIEMTRQRMRGSFEQQHFQTCPRCAGRGLIQRPDSVAASALRAPMMPITVPRMPSIGAAVMLAVEQEALGTDHGANGYTGVDEADLIGERLALSPDATLLDRYAHFYIPRRRPSILRRNAILALANSVAATQPGSSDLSDRALDVLGEYLNGPDELLRLHSAWAIGRIGGVLVDRLEDGGTWYIATDWANYAEHIDEVFSRSDSFSLVERREHDGEAPLDRPQTKFERRGLGKGHRIVDWCFRRNGSTRG